MSDMFLTIGIFAFMMVVTIMLCVANKGIIAMMLDVVPYIINSKFNPADESAWICFFVGGLFLSFELIVIGRIIEVVML